MLALFYTGFKISPVVSVWIMVPSNDVKCGAGAMLTKYNLADAVEPGCNRMAHFGQNWWLMPIQKLMLPKLYQGPHFTSSNPRFELKIKGLRSYGLLLYPKYKVIFEWNEKQKICIPRGVITIIKSGGQRRCEEFYNPHQEYDDSAHGESFGRHLKAQRDYELLLTKSDYSPESIFNIGDMPPPRGFFKSAQSYKNDRLHELLLPSSSLEVSHPGGSNSRRKSEHLSSQKSSENLPISSPLRRQKSALVPQRSNPIAKSRFSRQKSFSSTSHNSAPQIQRSYSMLSNMASRNRRFQDSKPRSKTSADLCPQAPSEMSLAPLQSSSTLSDQRLHNSSKNQERRPQSKAKKLLNEEDVLQSEPILSDKRIHDSSKNQERPQPKVCTPLNGKGVVSSIIIENSQDLGLTGLLKSP